MAIATGSAAFVVSPVCGRAFLGASAGWASVEPAAGVDGVLGVVGAFSVHMAVTVTSPVGL